jgi:hypothetical protein
MYLSTRNSWALIFAPIGVIIMLASCHQEPLKSIHDLVYQELTKTTPAQFRLAKVKPLSTNDLIPQSRPPESSFVTITAEESYFVSVNDTVPGPCTPGKPCLQMSLSDILLSAGKDTVSVLTSFHPNTSFQTDQYKVEVMTGTLSQRVGGSLFYIDRIRPGERYFIMKVSPK